MSHGPCSSTHFFGVGRVFVDDFIFPPRPGRGTQAWLERLLSPTAIRPPSQALHSMNIRACHNARAHVAVTPEDLPSLSTHHAHTTHRAPSSLHPWLLLLSSKQIHTPYSSTRFLLFFGLCSLPLPRPSVNRPFSSQHPLLPPLQPPIRGRSSTILNIHFAHNLLINARPCPILKIISSFPPSPFVCHPSVAPFSARHFEVSHFHCLRLGPRYKVAEIDGFVGENPARGEKREEIPRCVSALVLVIPRYQHVGS